MYSNLLALSPFDFGLLGVFIIGYYFIAAEEKYHINKAKPALFIGTFMFLAIGVYYAIAGLDYHPLHESIEELILEISEIFFFLLVAMTYIESLIERGVFEALKYKLIANGYSFKKLFWITGIISFFLSPIADNLTTALILSTVLITIERENRAFLIPSAINIVVAANAGGAWSPFGDITTLMAWIEGKGTFMEFLSLFPASIVGWAITAYLLYLGVPEGFPGTKGGLKEAKIKKGGKTIIFLGVMTIAIAISTRQFLHLPPMWGMLFGLAILKLYAYALQIRQGEKIDIFGNMQKTEIDTLLFFFGILSAVGALHFIGFLDIAVKLYDIFGATYTNIGVGVLSAIVDNIPVMSAVLKSDPSMGHDQWMLVTLTVGIGGSLISFGSAAGVGVMGKLRGIYTFGAHMKEAWKVAIGYAVSIVIWYVQFEILGFY